MNSTTYFSESQKFRNPLIWIFLIIINCVIIYFLLKAINLASGNSESIVAPSIAVGILILSTIFIYKISLDTEIRADGIYFRFYPFQLKYHSISKESINNIYVRKYNSLKEYGGWGYRVSITGKGKAMNVSGNEGIQIVYDTNKKVLIGTQKAKDVEMVLSQWYYEVSNPAE